MNKRKLSGKQKEKNKKVKEEVEALFETLDKEKMEYIEQLLANKRMEEARLKIVQRRLDDWAKETSVEVLESLSILLEMLKTRIRPEMRGAAGIGDKVTIAVRHGLAKKFVRAFIKNEKWSYRVVHKNLNHPKKENVKCHQFTTSDKDTLLRFFNNFKIEKLEETIECWYVHSVTAKRVLLPFQPSEKSLKNWISLDKQVKEVKAAANFGDFQDKITSVHMVLGEYVPPATIEKSKESTTRKAEGKFLIEYQSQAYSKNVGILRLHCTYLTYANGKRDGN